MGKSLMDDAFGHHTWATLQVIDACIPLTPEQLKTTVPGTYGSILDTIRHIVGGDSWYLFDMTGEPAFRIEEKQMDRARSKERLLLSGRTDSGARTKPKSHAVTEERRRVRESVVADAGEIARRRRQRDAQLRCASSQPTSTLERRRAARRLY